MKFALIFSLLFLSSVSIGASLGVASKVYSPGQRPAAQAKLELSTRIDEYLSCFPDALTLRLILSFRNTGATPIILDKRSSVVGRYVVSRDLKALAAKEFEGEIRSEYDAGPYISEAIDVGANVSNFVELAPGEVYETKSDWSRVHFTVNDGSPHSEAGLRYGTHVVQIEVGTWFFPSEKAARQARQQLKDKGFLWTAPIKSVPMEFIVDRDRPISKCR